MLGYHAWLVAWNPLSWGPSNGVSCYQSGGTDVVDFGNLFVCFCLLPDVLLPDSHQHLDTFDLESDHSGGLSGDELLAIL